MRVLFHRLYIASAECAVYNPPLREGVIQPCFFS
jgi:hypothetical protein